MTMRIVRSTSHTVAPSELVSRTRSAARHMGHGSLCFAGRHYGAEEWHCRCGEAIFARPQA
jgi:hypothetical protein